jgi:hypothetical protein
MKNPEKSWISGEMRHIQPETVQEGDDYTDTGPWPEPADMIPVHLMESAGVSPCWLELYHAAKLATLALYTSNNVTSSELTEALDGLADAIENLEIEFGQELPDDWND